MSDVDWNATVLILDTLSEGAYSFAELDDYICRHHGRDAVLVALAYLSKRQLIVISEGHGSADLALPASIEGALAGFFSIAESDRRTEAKHFLSLTAKGEAALGILGLGHP